MKKENKILTYDWDYYTIFQPVMKTAFLSEYKLNSLYKDLLLKLNSGEFQNRKIKFFSRIYKEINRQ